MTINDMVYMAIEGYMVEIWDCDTEETLWKGWDNEIPDEYLEMEINSWNCIPNGICFNV